MKTVAFDIETGSAEELMSFGPGYVRLCGWKTVGEGSAVTTSADPQDLIGALMEADSITGHYIIDFDLKALAKWNGAPYEVLAAKSWDGLLVERHLTPVAARGVQPRGFHGLDATAERYGVAGKSSVDFDGKREIIRRVKGDKVADKLKRGKEDSFPVLKLLAALYGGFHLIPQDDPDYVHYLHRDVIASENLFLTQVPRVAALPSDQQRYIRREHAVAATMGRTSLTGFRVDVDETMRRWSDGQARLEDSKKRLHEDHGMPLEGKFPHRSNPGKAAFRQALLDTGISPTALDRNWPLGKDGSLLTGKEVLNGMIEVFDRSKPDAAELCRTILAMNGEKSFPGTILSNVIGDRVHPAITSTQSTGRFGVTNPGLTVAAKRGPKGAWERGILLADSRDEVLVAIDANAVDVRMVAAMSGDTEFHKLFLPGVDFHSTVADKVFGRHDGDWRRLAKIGGIGSLYGLGANGMAVQMGVEVDVAQRFLRGMDESFPGVAEWKNETRAAAGALPYGETAPSDDDHRILVNPFGRTVRVERVRAYTQACALLGQSATRDGMAQAVLSLPKDLRRRIRVIVHDELVFSLPREGVEEAAQKIADSMAFNLLGVDITFGVEGYGYNWADVYSKK